MVGMRVGGLLQVKQVQEVIEGPKQNFLKAKNTKKDGRAVLTSWLLHLPLPCHTIPSCLCHWWFSNMGASPSSSCTAFCRVQASTCSLWVSMAMLPSHLARQHTCTSDSWMKLWQASHKTVNLSRPTGRLNCVQSPSDLTRLFLLWCLLITCMTSMTSD